MAGRKQAALRRRRRARIRWCAAALLLVAILLWPTSGTVDEAALDGSAAQAQVLAPGSNAAVQTAPAPTVAPDPTATSAPTASPVPTATPIPEPTTITLTFGGDCTLAGDVNKNNTRFQSFVEEHGYDYFFAELRTVFEADDLTILNLEGPLTTATTKRPNRQFNFRGDPDNARILAGSSVEVVNLANNHARDFLAQGYEDTVAAVDAAGVTSYGYSQTQVLDVQGVRVGLIGLTEWDYTLDEVTEMVSALRQECDVLIATFHWGEERRYTSTTSQRKYAQAAVEAGADAVVGHHSHVISGVAEYEGVPVVFSLGNLCFGGNSKPTDMDAMLFQMHFTVDHTGALVDRDFTVLPVRVSGNASQNDYQPYIPDGNEGQRILDKIAEYSTVDIF